MNDSLITKEERQRVTQLIKAFDNHGCGQGLDLVAQSLLRRLMEALDQAEEMLAAHGSEN